MDGVGNRANLLGGLDEVESESGMGGAGRRDGWAGDRGDSVKCEAHQEKFNPDPMKRRQHFLKAKNVFVVYSPMAISVVNV
jgi:hypothetical protein